MHLRVAAGRVNYHALGSRSRKRARALWGGAARLLGGVCRMIESGQTLDPDRRQTVSFEPGEKRLALDWAFTPLPPSRGLKLSGACRFGLQTETFSAGKKLQDRNKIPPRVSDKLPCERSNLVE